MNRKLGFILTIAAIALASIIQTSSADLSTEETRAAEREASCAGMFYADADPRAPKYAPDRRVDILHVAIDVTPNFEERMIQSKIVIRFAPIAEPLDEFQLDAIDLDIASVECTAEIEAYQNTGRKLILTFKKPIAPGTETTATIRYSAEPQRGLYFRTAETGYPAGDTHIWTQGESHEAPHWFPNYDYPNEKFTSEVTARVPKDMVVISNGKRMSETIDPDTGLKAVRWFQDKPHVNYLIALAAGHFKKIEDKYRDIPLTFYTPASLIDLAPNSFRDTKDAMGFFEKEIGVPYPWNKYAQVVVYDPHFGGMENTNTTILTDRTLFTSATENVRSSQGLVAHELVHMWFGDLVTCKDWSHLWLNEGFATYYANLYDGHANGRDSMLYRLYRDRKRVIGQKDEPTPIVFRNYERASEQFGYRAYTKGGWVLHMLRMQLGEELYRECIKTYVERHAYGVAVTEDLNRVIEEVSGRSFDPFFDQWVYHAHHPELEVSYTWSEKEKTAKIGVKQTQKVTDKVLLFKFPAKVRFVVDGENVDQEFEVTKAAEDFSFTLSKAPKIVRFDPDLALLADIKFNKPTAMLYAQLANKDDVVGRLLAIDALESKKDGKTLEVLKKALSSDSFYGVRIAASQALREIHTEEAFEALLDCTKQDDARVRQRVASDVAGFYREESLERVKQLLGKEKNPDVLAPLIRALGRYADEDSNDLIRGYLRSDSYRNTLADAAIGAIRSRNDPSFTKDLMNTLRERESAFTPGGFGRGLNALAYINRTEDEKSEVREFIAAYVNSPKTRVQTAAIDALGELRDPRAIPIVETFTAEDTIYRVQQIAKEALEKLQKTGEIPVAVSDLRREVLELQKSNKKIEEELEQIKKQIEPKPDQKQESKQKRRKFLGIF